MEANMRPIAILATVILCAAVAGCAPYAAQTAGAAAVPTCETSKIPVTVGGRPEQATVEACPQPDGSWRITQTTPGLPPQVYVMPPPPAGAYPSAYWGDDYLDYWPDWVAGPWFWGIGPTVVVVQHFDHFHHFHHFAGGHPGFGRPMPHGGPGHAMAASSGGGGAHR
jgi:hypothetical protein